MDLTTVDRQFLEVWIRHSAAMEILKGIDGTILWANDEFLQWIGYSLPELQKLTWMQISISELGLESELQTLRSLDHWNPRCSFKKQYIPKNEKAAWGTLTILRFPLEGELKFYGCTWEPLKNGTATAFNLAMEKYDAVKKELQLVNVQVSTLTSQSEEDRWLVSTISMARKHPRISAFILFICASVFGANNVIELLQRTGYLPVPHSTVPTKPPGEIAIRNRATENYAFYELDSNESAN